ncbi:MAG: AAA family ATPase [Candidatus Calescibacterium sp.]|nr:AAA family ATPase [Candidatus Calescibacterium sp.]MCS7244309.1 AAA family ATPase [Candidatus Calescibacterium sp.]MDW8133231.1 AAA family ATPase [Candidatus Calescibacterium sp.]
MKKSLSREWIKDLDLPKWAKELIRFVSVKPQFVIYGNIYDTYPLKVGEKYIPLSLEKFIGELFTNYENYGIVLSFEPLDGFKIIKGKNELKEIVSNLNVETRDGFEFIPIVVLNEVYDFSEGLIKNDIHHVVLIFNFSSRKKELTGREYNEFMYRMYKLSINSVPKKIGTEYSMYNPVVMLFDKDNDCPLWYTYQNPRIKTLAIPKPDIYIRKLIISSLIDRLDGVENLDENTKKETINYFVDQTTGMYSVEILSIINLAKREKLPVNQLNEAIRRYKVGIIDNPWAKLDREKLKNAENIIKRRVIGQDKAVKKAVGIIKRAYYNLSGTQYSRYSQRPKGVLFLAGPTGVGKTELAKSIAELIFGNESNCIRFDMSEFAREHSDQRLIGAPPGYVGYDVGGELTNALKQNPFSVILFDEIEKSHPKIMDIFLQILDDGRLTSGKGETVYFSESIIVFTSNLGVYEIFENRRIQKLSLNDNFEKLEKTVKEAIDNYFKAVLGRAEILNRIGENIVVFDFIRSNYAELIFEKMLNNVLYKLQEDHKIQLVFSGDIKRRIMEYCISDLSMGGRGIGNKLEEVFITPLAELLFDLSVPENSKVIITSLREDNGIFTLAGDWIAI